MSSGLGGLGLHHPSRPHFPPPGPEFANASKPRAGGASPKWVIFCSSALPAGCEGQDGPIRPPGGGDEGWGRRQKGGRGEKSVGPRCGAHSVIRNEHPGSFTTTLVRWYRAEARTWDRGSIRLGPGPKAPGNRSPVEALARSETILAWDGPGNAPRPSEGGWTLGSSTTSRWSAGGRAGAIPPSSTMRRRTSLGGPIGASLPSWSPAASGNSFRRRPGREGRPWSAGTARRSSDCSSAAYRPQEGSSAECQPRGAPGTAVYPVS